MREETLVRHIVRHKRVLEGMIAALVGDFNVAEDLFQEIAVVMTRRREEADEDTPFVAWGRAILLNVVRDYRRKCGRMRVRIVQDELLESVARAFDERADAWWDARRQALRACVDKLPSRERDLLRRRYEQETPVAELASSLSATRGAVDTLLYRIRKALMTCVESRLQSQEPA